MNKVKLTSLAAISLTSTLLLSSVSAQAESLSIIDSAPISFAGYNGQPADSTGVFSTGFLGSIVANGPGTITFTYLGNESGYSNKFTFSGITFTEANSVGTSASALVDAGTLNFSFSDNQGGTFSNGSTATPVLGFAILNGSLTPVVGPNYGLFDYVLGFNDSSSGDADYDDFVVGVSFAPISAVPLPASLPLMAAALGLFTFARRRI